jgi:hypothetical protein
VNKRSAGNPYIVLAVILSFYLLAQIFQQYVILFSPISSPVDEKQAFVFSQDGLNFARLTLILFSMFFMVIAWAIICFHFYEVSRFRSVSAFIFLVFFCLFEVLYRSVELFTVVSVWGHEAAAAEGEDFERLADQYKMFNSLVSAIYFPLLFSQFLGSPILYTFRVLQDHG